MLDLNFIRENPELVKQAVAAKKENADIDRLLEIDERRRELIREVEDLRHRQKVATEEIAAAKRQKQDASEKIAAMRDLSRTIGQLGESLREVEDQLHELRLTVPNVPHHSAPLGEDESANRFVKDWGEKPDFSFEPRPHWEVGEILGIIDLPRGAKVTGSGFPVMVGPGARLERALINFMLDMHTTRHGYTEMFVPYLANAASMTGTGQLPKLADDMYHVEHGDLYLIPTGEVPVTNLHRDEILPGDSLPIYYTAFTPCFRREAGAHGRDTRGLIRVHQFHKVELVKFCTPQESYAELEKLLGEAEEVLQALGLHYRVVELCTGDLSFASAKTYDIEVYAPGVDAYLEVSSCSNFEDFQARRINIRYRPAPREKPRFVHTLNGSGVALPRLMVAVLETYQTENGSVTIPEPLQPFMGGISEITRAG